MPRNPNLMPQGIDHSSRPIIVDPHMNHQKMSHVSGLPYFPHQPYPGNVEQHYQVPQRVTRIEFLMIFTSPRFQRQSLNQPKREV